MVEEASEFLKDLRLAITERISSPLVGTYWISWFIWNFKFVLIVFSGEAIESKLQLIHDEMFWAWWAYLITYGGPLGMTVLFIFAYPKPAEIVYQYRLKYQQKLNAIRQKEENEQLLTAEETRQHRLDIREKERKIKLSLDEMEKEVADLRSENESLRSKVALSVTEGRSPEIDDGESGAHKDEDAPYSIEYDFIQGIDELTPLEIGVMSVISSNYPKRVSEEELLRDVSRLKFESEVSKSRIRMMDAVESLKKNQFIDVGSTIGGRAYGFTGKGKLFASEHDL